MLPYQLGQQELVLEDPSGTSVFPRQHLLKLSKFTSVLETLLRLRFYGLCLSLQLSSY